MTPAERQRLYRQRQKRGVRVARLEYDEVISIEALIAARRLNPSDADDPAKVAAALEEYLALCITS